MSGDTWDDAKRMVETLRAAGWRVTTFRGRAVQDGEQQITITLRRGGKE